MTNEETKQLAEKLAADAKAAGADGAVVIVIANGQAGFFRTMGPGATVDLLDSVRKVIVENITEPDRRAAHDEFAKKYGL